MLWLLPAGGNIVVVLHTNKLVKTTLVDRLYALASEIRYPCQKHPRLESTRYLFGLQSMTHRLALKVD